MICIMIPKVNLGVGEMGLCFEIYRFFNNPSLWDINSTNLPVFTSLLKGNTSDSQSSS